MKAHSKIASILLVLSFLFLTACGSGNGNEIVIGVISPTTGQSAKMGQDMNNAIQMAVDEINGKGGVNNKKIRLVFADDACDPQASTTAANKLVSENVSAVIGGYCSSAVLPASGVFNSAGIPMVVTAANSEKIPENNYKNIFLLNSTASAQAQTATNYMISNLKGKKIAILNDNTAYSVDLAERTRDAIQKAGGQVVLYESVDPNASDFNSVLTKVKSKTPDATYWTGYYAAGGLLIKQFKQQGVSGSFGVADGSVDQTLIKIAGENNAEGVFATMSPLPQFIPGAKNWSKDYETKFKQAPGPYSALSYDGMRLIIHALEQAKSDDPNAITGAIAKTKGFATFAGPVEFKANGTLTKSNFIMIGVKNGQFEMVK
ncbi:branched-chain amino acid ABC transporter substrate-binding protein [Shimazuella kribbensis]|uniref:branched-chain amino acid ABC transporter substrate-binding protein n=1 Tax=Shimazuella kribbensis TaxID=139808 RepID=UPI00041DECDF|nr:branched-chain amino acid ABC transporter substrate-binding protein [Shimazuella kribbensis]